MLAKTWATFESCSIIPDLKMRNEESLKNIQRQKHAFAQRAVRYYGKGGEGNTF